MVKPFVPQLVYVEPKALEYPLGKELITKFENMGIEIRKTTSHNQIRNLPGDNHFQRYRVAKSTLVVGLRKTLKFDTSKPSAEYAIPFATGCMGHCHYCYLQTTMGSKPYIRTYVNVEEIFEAAEGYMGERAPEITRFEASCTSDIVGVDHLTHTLKRAIEFFGQSEYGQLRFVTKFAHVDHLLDAKHNGRTRFRFSINDDYIIKYFEPGTSRLHERIEAAVKVAEAGYPLGFIVAPIYLHEGWKSGYHEMFEKLKDMLPEKAKKDMTFELIQHRFTKPAKRVIEKNYPMTKLELDEAKRKYKWGRYGIGKYVYKDEEQADIKATLGGYIEKLFPNAKIEYFT
ncbi:spore photoproduct lyase [Virgibacillus pantothenticus]|uniref:Spore photoproduct lyase n=1 Tax=Virgibacillus pantothenticus TaxID=1473 RepID=A0A0L0QMY6_VIRPA|nr:MULTISPECIES: spore photoproduct lyase [Virgibacillus]API93646.1 spore photoproduct lyase [Virgibacillus sp. 6R]KNE19936.1 radical SAM protein [Virgibacillus pantothenticus]MBS7429960.1 spore photoproduct lyase [Virgibacillus sp. 19R1-5]MBU8564942.1 spore photoproduct lyase [Virgibacillus pantothenticus]MBU8599250.1 spore photoproduct lyase [Virgibacillus pantothenticus]